MTVAFIACITPPTLKLLKLARKYWPSLASWLNEIIIQPLAAIVARLAKRLRNRGCSYLANELTDTAEGDKASAQDGLDGVSEQLDESIDASAALFDAKAKGEDDGEQEEEESDMTTVNTGVVPLPLLHSSTTLPHIYIRPRFHIYIYTLDPSATHLLDPSAPLAFFSSHAPLQSCTSIRFATAVLSSRTCWRRSMSIDIFDLRCGLPPLQRVHVRCAR